MASVEKVWITKNRLLYEGEASCNFSQKLPFCRLQYRVRYKAEHPENCCPEEGCPEPIDIEAFHYSADEPEEQPVNDEGEEAEGKECNWQGEDDEDRPDNGVEDSEDKRNEESRPEGFHGNTGHHVGDENDQERIDEPTEEEHEGSIGERTTVRPLTECPASVTLLLPRFCGFSYSNPWVSATSLSSRTLRLPLGKLGVAQGRL